METSADSQTELLPPDRLRLLSVPPRPAEVPSLQGDCSSVPLTITRLLSGRSSAAFRGLTELKSTAERQPMKPEEAGLESCGSSSESGEGMTRIILLYCLIFCPRSFLNKADGRLERTLSFADTRVEVVPSARSSAELKVNFLLFLPCTFPRTSDLTPFNSTSDVRLKSSLLFLSIWEKKVKDFY